MLPVFLLISLLFTTFTAASIVNPANVFTGCQTKDPGSTVQTGTYASATACNIQCSKTQASTGANKSIFQASTGTCSCSKGYGQPPEADYGNADQCIAGDFDTRIISTSFTLVGCYSNLVTNVPFQNKTGPNGCLTACSATKSVLQVGFYINSKVSTSILVILNEYLHNIRIQRITYVTAGPEVTIPRPRVVHTRTWFVTPRHHYPSRS
jgi:hypothetical protein